MAQAGLREPKEAAAEASIQPPHQSSTSEATKPSHQPSSQPSTTGDLATKLPPYRFAHASGKTSKRYVVTPLGTFHLTPTELALVRVIEELDGKAISRADLAQRLHRNTKVISRLISNLRREGIIQSEPVFGENGAQLANRYWVSQDAVPMD